MVRVKPVPIQFPQRQHAARWQTFSVDRVRAPPVIARQPAISRKPGHAKFRLRDGVRPILERMRGVLAEIANEAAGIK